MIECDLCGETFESGYDLDEHEYEHQQQTSRQVWSDKRNNHRQTHDTIGSDRLEGWPWWTAEWLYELDIIRQDLTDREYDVLVELARFCDGAGRTYAGMQSVAKKVGIGRTVADRAVAKAEQRGLIHNHGKKPGSRSYRRSIVLVHDDVRQHEHAEIVDIYDWIKRTGPNWWPSLDGDRDLIPVSVDLVALRGELPIQVQKCTGKGSRWCSDPARCTKAPETSSEVEVALI